MTPHGCDPPSLSCRDLVDLVTDYLEGAMDPATAASFERHAHDCPPCLEHLEQMKLTVRAAGGVSDEAITPEARSALMERFRDWNAGRGG